MKQTQLKGVLILFLTAVIWGSAFVTQSMGMESVEPFTFNGIRMLIGAAVLAPVILIKDAVTARRPGAPTKE
ncbi:MAG: DMT family transporter, partial [Clostridia bacterium]|nr:DMT family transporter [Clostridia bacterium]